MDYTGSRGVMVESLHKRGRLLLFLCFFAQVALFIVTGLFGPEVLAHQGSEATLMCSDSACDSSWKGSLVHMSKLHQALYLEGTILKPESVKVGLEYDQTIFVTASGTDSANQEHLLADRVEHVKHISCPAEATTCNTIVLFTQSFIHYSSYHVEVEFLHAGEAWSGYDMSGGLKAEFTLVRFNSAFTEFELIIRYMLIMLTLCVMVIYYWRLRVARGSATMEQRWVGALLASLLMFDNPLFALEIYSPDLIWTGISSVLAVSFLALLLLFWLIVVDMVRTAAVTSRRTAWFYLPKVALIFVFWLATLGVYLYTRLQQSQDASFNANDDVESFTVFHIFVLSCLGVYAVWLLVLVCLAAKELRQLSIHFRIVFLLSLAAIVINIIGVLLGAYSPFPTHSALFTTFYGSVNSYLWLLAVSYIPVTMGGGDERELVNIIDSGDEEDGGDLLGQPMHARGQEFESDEEEAEEKDTRL